MQVRHVKTALHGQPRLARPQALCWSPNNKRLAVADAQRYVHLFDEAGERRDKFAVKPADSNKSRGFVVTGMAWSPDSAKLAIAQSDCLVAVYRLGLEWGEKKSIGHKFAQSSAVTCVAWPNTSSQGVELVAFGTQEGKVKVGVLKANKAQTLYAHEHAVVALSTSVNHTRLVSGHVDGAVYVYIFDTDSSNNSNNGNTSSYSSSGGGVAEVAGARKLFQHNSVPYTLVWAEHIVVAGGDGVVAFYHPRTGKRVQSFDYDVAREGGFASGACNPSGHALVVASRERLRVFDYNARARRWEESTTAAGKVDGGGGDGDGSNGGTRGVLYLPHAYTMPVMAWKYDGSRLAVGALTGAVDLYDTCLRRYRVRGAFEFTYVCHNQVIVRRLATGTRLVLRSSAGNAIERVNVYRDRYLVAYTSTTLLVGDLVSCKLSEVPWQQQQRSVQGSTTTGASAANSAAASFVREKFVFDNPHVCMVFTVGELCLIEYGKNALLGTCRTEEHNAHRISVRIHDGDGDKDDAQRQQQQQGSSGGTVARVVSTTAGGGDADSSGNKQQAATAAATARKLIAYLIDRQTLQVDDLVSGVTLLRLSHTYKIDWLELNDRADKLLFRDKQHQLLLYDMAAQQRTTLLTYCTYVQWVPDSDVVVAQNRNELCVWYNVEQPERVVVVPIKGEVRSIERGAGKTEVLVDEGVHTVAYALDEALIAFRAAMDAHDLERACELLDRVALTPATRAMWATLAAAALSHMRLRVAERCYAALGDVTRVRALTRIHDLAIAAAAASNNNSNNATGARKSVDEEAVADVVAGDDAGGKASAAALSAVAADYSHYTVQAELCILGKDFHRAEQLYLDHGDVAAALRMWEEMGCHDAALALATARGLDDVPTRRARYYSWLMETAQFDKAGEVREREGKYTDAIALYLRGGTPTRAARLVVAQQLRPEQALLEAIAAALVKAHVYEQAGEFFERLQMHERAIATYVQGHVYARAVECARRHSASAAATAAEAAGGGGKAAAAAAATRVAALEEAWGDYLVGQKQVDQAIKHYAEAGVYAKAVRAALESRQWSKAAELLDAHVAARNNNNNAASAGADGSSSASGGGAAATTVSVSPAEAEAYKRIARHYAEVQQYADAERYYIKGGAVGEAVDMYRRAGMTDAMYRVAQRHLTPQQLTALFVSQAKQLEVAGDYGAAERIYLKVNEPDQAILMYKRTRDFTNMLRLVQAYRSDYLLKTHLSLGAQFEKEGNYKLAETHYVAGKDWGRAVNMYRERDAWHDAVRVAKVHGGAAAARQVVLSRALVLDAEPGVQLLGSFALVDAGIDFALESQKFELALQWAQLAQPAKLPYVHLKYAMYYEDQGDFRLAEDAFVKAGKPREAIDMYVHQHDYDSAMRVAEAHEPGMVASICAAHARALFQQGSYKDSEVLLLQRAHAPEVLLKLYLEARMFAEAQRVAREHCPELLSEVARRVALESSDPQRAGAVLEESGEYQLAMDTYLAANAETVPEAGTLAQVWVRAVKVAQKHARKALKDVLQTVTTRLREAGRYADAGRCLEDCEEYKAAVQMYVQGRHFDLAEALAKRISADLEDYVRRAMVQDSIAHGTVRDARVVEELNPDAAVEAYVAKGDYDSAIRVAATRQSREAATQLATMAMQYHVRAGRTHAALAVVAKHPTDTDDFRFYAAWLELAQQVVPLLQPPTLAHVKDAAATEAAAATAAAAAGTATDKDSDKKEQTTAASDGGDNATSSSSSPPLPGGAAVVQALHASLVKVLASMTASGQQPDEVARCNALTHIVHIYCTAWRMHRDLGLSDMAVKLMLGLPRWVPHVAPVKAYYDAGMVAKEAGEADTGFIYLNHALDIVERIDDGDSDSAAVDVTDLATTDFPRAFALGAAALAGVTRAALEKANEWVLTMSIESGGAGGGGAPTTRVLPTVQDPQTKQAFFAGALRAPDSGSGGSGSGSSSAYPECAVTGYPLLGGGVVRCAACKRPASQDDWSRYVLVAKQCPWCEATVTATLASRYGAGVDAPRAS